MSTPLDECLAYAGHLNDEHRQIQTLVERIQASYFCGESATVTQDGQQRTKALVEQLGALRDRLCSHFEEEERGGCLEEAVSRVPRLGLAMAKLELQHGELLAQLAHIIDIARNYGFSHKTAPDVERAFGEFAEALYDHETTEDRILQQGFNMEGELGKSTNPSCSPKRREYQSKSHPK